MRGDTATKREEFLLRSSSLRRCLVLLAGAAALVAAIAGCGSSGTKASKVSMSISEKGKKASFQVPKSAKGGLVDLTFTNNGKAPHGVQLVQYTGNHTAADALKTVASQSNKTPEWIRGEGGTATIPGGQSDSATLNLPAGNYVVIDAAALGGGSGGPPATAETKFTSGDTGDLPSTPGTVTASNPGKDKYAWDISGLKTGKNEITFNSKGKEALHLIAAVPIKGKAPSIATIKKDLGKNGPPPSYIDASKFQTSAVLDGGLTQTTSLTLDKPGQYLFFCPLTDRDGGKSHDQEGLLKVVTVK
jgi:hypothetical protein